MMSFGRSYRTTGLIGFALFSVILAHCLVQIFHFNRNKTYKRRLYEHIKYLFHIVFGGVAFLECVNYSSYVISNSTTRWGYTCHLLALYLNLMAFTIVIYSWNHILASQNLLEVEWKYYAVFLGINFVSTIIEITLYAVYGDSGKSSFREIDGIAANVLYVVSLCFTALMLLLLGFRMKYKLVQSRQTTKSQALQILLQRINRCLLIFLFSYSMRIYFIGRLTLVWLLTGSEPDFEEYSELLWQVLTYWIPTVAPGAVFLYMMRFRSTAMMSVSGEGASTQLTESEQVYNYDLEDSSADTGKEYAEREFSSSSQTGLRFTPSMDQDLVVNALVSRMEFYSKDGGDLKIPDNIDLLRLGSVDQSSTYV